MCSRSALSVATSGGASWGACAQTEEANVKITAVGTSIRLMVRLLAGWPRCFAVSLTNAVDAAERRTVRLTPAVLAGLALGGAGATAIYVAFVTVPKAVATEEVADAVASAEHSR